ncbi:hypothetical protein RRF57_006092 [Xylaria bambusicola]|uniref:Thioredoxin domain-containing protein n=1 Tax=Xylaria bambusicola TaxID=326684 RepID=A0AAN7Z5B0_9PEZI
MDRSPIPETSGNVHKITSVAQLRALLASAQYVAIDFYADWCPPCRAIAPTFSQLAEDYGSVPAKLAFAKVNVDHVKDVAAEFGVTAMPTFMFFRDGKTLGESVRGANKPALETVVKALAAEVGVEKKEEVSE